jgi:hypothetical protein
MAEQSDEQTAEELQEMLHPHRIHHHMVIQELEEGVCLDHRGESRS